jgi:hypothetical protein
MARSGLPQYFKAINVGQLYVEDEPSGHDLVDAEQGSTAAQRDFDRIAIRLQSSPQDVADIRIAIHDENMSSNRRNKSKDYAENESSEFTIASGSGSGMWDYRFG